MRPASPHIPTPLGETSGEAGTPTSVQGILEALAAESGEGVPVWVERMNRIVQECRDLVAPEAALLVAAAQAGVPVASWARPVQGAVAARAVARSR